MVCMWLLLVTYTTRLSVYMCISHRPTPARLEFAVFALNRTMKRSPLPMIATTLIGRRRRWYVTSSSGAFATGIIKYKLLIHLYNCTCTIVPVLHAWLLPFRPKLRNVGSSLSRCLSLSLWLLVGIVEFQNGLGRQLETLQVKPKRVQRIPLGIEWGNKYTTTHQQISDARHTTTTYR